MNRHFLNRVVTLMTALGLAVTSLLLLFLLLGQITVGADPGENVMITDLNIDFCVCSGVWVSETVDSAGDIGAYTSLALAPTYPYTPHISYHDATSDSLKYAWLSGTTWLSETIDSGGTWTSLALVPTYPHTPCISYHDYQGAALRYACRDGITWTTHTVPGGYAGFGGTSLALEPIYPYTPHISYRSPLYTRLNIYHAYLSGTTWCSGTWKTEEVEPPLSETGGSSLALEPTYPYTPHISYFNDTNDDLKHAWKRGTTWLSETVDSGGDVGWCTSLALDSSGNLRISYLDNTNDALKYAWWNGTTWLSETVNSTGQPSWGRGATSLELDQADLPYISYYDAANGDMKFAHLSGTVWIIQTVDSAGDVGQFSSLALDQVGCPCISYYDATNEDLKYACLPPIKIYLPIITKNYLQP
jgi:hypothetical protein